MVHVVLYSTDEKLRSLLASALRPEYSIHQENDLPKLLRRSRQQDVIILDFDSNYSSLKEQLATFESVAESPLPVIVMTDDLRRSTAIEFIRRGAFDCIRKPPSLVEFKVIVGRAHEQAQMKLE